MVVNLRVGCLLGVYADLHALDHSLRGGGDLHCDGNHRLVVLHHRGGEPRGDEMCCQVAVVWTDLGTKPCMNLNS